MPILLLSPPAAVHSSEVHPGAPQVEQHPGQACVSPWQHQQQWQQQQHHHRHQTPAQDSPTPHGRLVLLAFTHFFVHDIDDLSRVVSSDKQFLNEFKNR